MKYQYGSEYDKDNSQRLPKYKQYLTRNLATNAALLNIIMTANMRQKGCETHLRNLTPVQKGYNPIESPLSLVNKRQRLMCVSHHYYDQKPDCSNIVWLPVVDPSGQLFPWIHRSRGQQRENIQERMFEIDRYNICSKLNAFEIRPGKISILFTHSDNWSTVLQLHFLASLT